MKNSKPKVVLITGASAGIGKACAETFYRHNYAVVLFARRREKLEALASQLNSFRPDGHVLVTAGDVTDRSQVFEAIEKTVRTFGRIDILINNAGAGLNAFVETVDPKAFQDVFNLNVLGPLHAIQAVIPVMKAQKSGQIVNVSSIIGKRALPSRSAYCTSKFALEGFSESIRSELRPYGIEVMVARPSTTDTEFFEVEPRGKEFVASTGFPRMSAQKVAREIYRGLARHKRAVTVSFFGKFFVFLSTVAPRLTDYLVERFYRQLPKNISSAQNSRGV